MAKKAKPAGPSKETVQRHFDRLSKLAAKTNGVLPPYTWLNRRGYFVSYDVVRKAGLLKKFKRASMQDR